jgi:aryl-alcohol dehydrogenase-like predicted oxidoreductase
VRLRAEDLGDIRGAIVRSIEASLRRLGVPGVDLLQLHNPIELTAAGSAVALRDVIEQAIPVFEDLRRQGKIRFFGITALGDPEALHRLIDTGALYTSQVFYNMLNPTAGGNADGPFPGVDFKGLLPRAKRKRVGAIGVRALAAGALSGIPGKHPNALPAVAPIASGATYAADLAAADVLVKLVKDGYVDTLAEAAYRFVISHEAISTVLVGASTLDHLEQAAAAVIRGPLPEPALARLSELWTEMRS